MKGRKERKNERQKDIKKEWKGMGREGKGKGQKKIIGKKRKKEKSMRKKERKKENLS